MERKVISIASACWNEVEKIPLFYERCIAALKEQPENDYVFIVEDNLSTDGTREMLSKIAAKDPKFKVILNANNFGHIRSPFNCLLNASCDVFFTFAAIFRDLRKSFISFWKVY